ARGGPEGVPGGMAETLRPDPRVPDRAPPGDQGPCADLPHAKAVRLHRESGGPCLHDDEGPAAVVPRRDQRGSPGGHETWGEGATRGGRERNEPGAHGPGLEIRAAATRGSTARPVH